MYQEKLPLRLEGVVEQFLLGYLRPTSKEVDGLLNIGVPDWLGRVTVVLRDALAESGHGGAFGTVHVQGKQVVAANARRPGRVELGDDPAFQLKGGVAGIVGGGFIGVALLVDALFDVGRTQAGHGFYFAKKMIQHVTPVTEHIDNDAAVVFFAVVPGRPLRRYAMAFKDPISKLPAY